MNKAAITIVFLVVASILAGIALTFFSSADEISVSSESATDATAFTIQEITSNITEMDQSKPPDVEVEMVKIIHEELIPILYASSDVDALIVGALLMHFSPIDNYSEFDFLNLAISLNPDDPLLLSVLARTCLSAKLQRESFARQEQRLGRPPSDQMTAFWQKMREQTKQRELFCEGRSFIDELFAVTGDNAWVWALLAKRESMNKALALEHLEKAAEAIYYNDFSMELRLLMMATLQKYGGDIKDGKSLQLIGISKTVLPPGGTSVINLCEQHNMEVDVRTLNACVAFAQNLLDSSTLIDQLTSKVILSNANRIKGEPIDSGMPAWFEVYRSGEWGNLAEDPVARAYYEELLLRYSEIDAMKQTMIKYKLIEDNGETPQEIKIHIVE